MRQHTMRQVDITSIERRTPNGHFVRSALNEGEIARFWSNVARRASDECWLWEGSVCGRPGHSYGRMQVGSGPTRGLAYAHRIAYELAYGPLGDGQGVCHRCDVTRCCNPAHLYSGTQADNIRDASSKGHLTVARKRNRSIKPDVVARYLAGGVTAKQLAAESSISFMTVHRWIHEATNGVDQRFRCGAKPGTNNRERRA